MAPLVNITVCTRARHTQVTRAERGGAWRGGATGDRVRGQTRRRARQRPARQTEAGPVLQEPSECLRVGWPPSEPAEMWLGSSFPRSPRPTREWRSPRALKSTCCPGEGGGAPEMNAGTLLTFQVASVQAVGPAGPVPCMDSRPREQAGRRSEPSSRLQLSSEAGAGPRQAALGVPGPASRQLSPTGRGRACWAEATETGRGVWVTRWQRGRCGLPLQGCANYSPRAKPRCPWNAAHPRGHAAPPQSRLRSRLQLLKAQALPHRPSTESALTPR